MILNFFRFVMRAKCAQSSQIYLYANMYIRDIVLMSPNIKTMLKPTPQVGTLLANLLADFRVIPVGGPRESSISVTF